MFSTDKNIETVTELLENIKSYFSASKDYLKYSIAEKLIRIIKAILMLLVIMILGFIAVIFLSIALLSWLSTIVGTTIAAIIVAGIYLTTIVTVIILRKWLIEKPLVRIVSSIFLTE